MITISKESITRASRNPIVKEWAHSDYPYFFARALANKYQLNIHSYQLDLNSTAFRSSVHCLTGLKARMEKEQKKCKIIARFMNYFYWEAQPKIEKLKEENAPNIELVRCLVEVFYKSYYHEEPWRITEEAENWQDLKEYDKTTIVTQFVEKLIYYGYNEPIIEIPLVEELNAYLELTYQAGTRYYLKNVSDECMGLLIVTNQQKSMTLLEASYSDY